MAGASRLLLVQTVATPSGSCRVLWDTGSQLSLVSEAYAARHSLGSAPATLHFTVVSGRRVEKPSRLHRLELIDRQGARKEVMAYSLDEIAGPVKGMDLGADGAAAGDARARPADLMVGLRRPELHPRYSHRRGRLHIFTSDFGTGRLAVDAEDGGGGRGRLESAAAACHVRDVRAAPVDFISAEAMGVEIPRRCAACEGCKECTFRVAHLTWKEAEELRVIEKGLVLDVERRRWVASYPYMVDPSVLADNRVQAIHLMKGLERRLRKRGRLDEFNAAFNETVERGVFAPVAEPDRYRGPINYISLVEAFKEGPGATTPLRLCLNSSLAYRGRSLNSILMKGPSALTELYSVAVKFRQWEVAVVRDLKKFYQSVEAAEPDRHLRRVVWRQGDEAAPITTYISTTVNFGDKPAGAVAMTALRHTAAMHRDVHPTAAKAITESSYVDDTVGGGADRAEAEDVSDGMDRVASMGGFTYGEAVISGDVDIERPTRKVLGTVWFVSEDMIGIDIRINFGPKVRGARTAPDADLDNVGACVPEELSKRLVWRVALGQFDLLGLVAPFLLRLKLLMRGLSGEGAPAGWDAAVTAEQRAAFVAVAADMAAVSRLRFPRCVRPAGVPATAELHLVTFVDGSGAASCALVYACWRVDGRYQCRLVTGKTRVAPLKRISIPRMELQAAVIGVRLAAKVQAHLDLEVKQRRFFTDSSAVLGMFKGNMSLYREFVATRVAEVKSKSLVEEWSWIPTDSNMADLGTRGEVNPEQMGLGSEYQDGPEWLRGPEAGWPCRDSFGAVPSEELLAQAHAGAAATTAGAAATAAAGGPLFRLVGELSSLRRVVAVVLLAVDVWRGRAGPPDGGGPAATVIHGRAASYVAGTLDVLSWLEKPFEEWALAGLRRLGPRPREWAAGRRVLVVGGQRGELTTLGGDQACLPVFDGRSIFGRHLLRDAHAARHAGVARTVLEVRKRAWVTDAAAVAKGIVADCMRCRRERAKEEVQVMAPLPPSRTEPAPAFRRIAVDLFGPVVVVDAVKRRTKREAYGLLAVCLASTAVHLELCGNYSADAVVLALRRMFALRGTPAEILSDPGTQMLAAGRAVALWECAPVAELSAKGGIIWRAIPAASQHANGLAKRLIAVVKRALLVAAPASGAGLIKEEWDTLLAEVMEMVNSRPLAVTGGVESFCPITPNHLLLGRSTAGVPAVPEQGGERLTRRLRYVGELADEFWAKWTAHVLPIIRRQNRWFEEGREVRVDDVVLLRYESRVQRQYKLGRVVEAAPSEADGRVRTVVVAYCAADGGERRVRRSVHTIAVIIPVEDQ